MPDSIRPIVPTGNWADDRFASPSARPLFPSHTIIPADGTASVTTGDPVPRRSAATPQSNSSSVGDRVPRYHRVARVGVGPFGAAGFRVVTQGFEAGDDGSRPSDESGFRSDSSEPGGHGKSGRRRSLSMSRPRSAERVSCRPSSGSCPGWSTTVIGRRFEPSPSTADAVSGAVSARRYLRAATMSPGGRPLSP